MVFDGEAERLDEGAIVLPGGDGFGDLVEVAEEDKVLAVAVLPEVGAVHQNRHAGGVTRDCGDMRRDGGDFQRYTPRPDAHGGGG